jgi:riboflavin synthase
MFTGIVENLGTLEFLEKEQDNLLLTMASSLQLQLKVDESVAHNGICLTVTELLDNDRYKVCAIGETIQKTTIGNWALGDTINIERAMLLGARLDGHLVQGHVDCAVKCTGAQVQNGSWGYTFELPPAYAALVIEKGSICINGTSLTCFNVSATSFEVAIIPYTYKHTNFNLLREGDFVNVEFDLIGKYLQRQMQLASNT